MDVTMTLSQGHDGLSARRMAVFCTFRKPSLCRQVHRECIRNALLDVTPIVPATAYHQSTSRHTVGIAIIAKIHSDWSFCPRLKVSP